MKALEVKNLKKTYGDFEAVKNLNFEINHGEIFALIGPNGAGKSTTLKMLATILNPTAGEAFVFGNSILHSAAEVRKIISYLPEEAGAYKNLTGHQYLAFMADIYTANKTESQTFVAYAGNLTKLGKRLNDKVKSYSKGMTRKLLLARTVMTKPKLAILDEPTSGLDIINGLEIRHSIKALAKEGMSVLLSSHNMLEIEYLSDRVGIINQGALLEIGTPAELKTKYQANNLEEIFFTLTKSA